MGGRRRMRGRWAIIAVSLAMVGCVAPAALTGSQPSAAPVDPVTMTQVESSAEGSAQAAEPAAVRKAADAEAASARPEQSRAEVPLPTPSPMAPVLAEWRHGGGLAGFDVSRYQRSVDWDGLVESGHGFVYVKATEGTSHRSPTHDDQRKAARDAGLVQGAYHYARPNQSSGTLQARFFNAAGGTWSADGLTLPGALDLEFAENGPRCHGLGPSRMTAWVREFSDEYRRLSGRIPVIYTTAEFWDACTGGNRSFSDHPLWLFDHADKPGALPTGWERPTLWQRAVEANLDRNVFFGSRAQLAAWASAPLR